MALQVIGTVAGAIDSREANTNESQTFCKENLREVQNHKAQGSRYGYLRKSQAQAAPGLIPAQYLEVSN